MIKSKIVNVKITPYTYKWFKSKGYNVEVNKSIDVDISDISEYSTVLIDVECQRCGIIKSKKNSDYKYAINKSFDNKYYCKSCSYTNRKNTNLIKYGSITPLTNKHIKEKSNKTMIKKYGVDNISKVESIKEDRSIFMKNEYEKNHKLFVDKYKVSNPSKLDWVKEKKKKTTLKNWGVENPSQNSFIFEKSQKSGKKIKQHENGIWYRGTYEKDFLDLCLANNIKVEKGPTINFRYKNKNKCYHSDFFLPDKNLIVEIKSSYYYEMFKDLNENKKRETENAGYNFIFIINKNYVDFISLISKI